MKGYWHVIAIAAIVAILATSFDHIFFYLFFLLWIYWLYRKKKVRNIHVTVAVIILLFCSVYFGKVNDISPEQDDRLLQSFSGKITSEITDTSTKTEFEFRDNKTNQQLLITLFKNGNASDIKMDSLQTGATCTIIGNKETPSRSRNPGQFDYGNYLKQQAIDYQLIIEKVQDVNCSGASSLQLVYEIRKKAITHTESKLTDFTASWLHALVLGEDKDINEDVIELFQKWNLSHLLAISGLHVGLLVGCIYFFLVKLQLLTREKAQGLLILVLPIYPLISGGAPSVWRASLMTLFVFVLLKCKIRLPLTDVVSLIFLVFVIIDRHIVTQLGFQFSFLVTFSLLLSKNIISPDHSKILILLRISFISLMSVLPLQTYHFYFFNPLSVIVNLLLVPYFTLFVMPFMFILLLLSITIASVVPVLDKFFVIVHQSVINGLEVIDNYMYFPWVTGQFPIELFIVYYILFITFH